MTVSYKHDGRGRFIHLFMRWKGSIFKLVWPELLLFTVLYFSCSAIYRFVLNESQQRQFEKIANYCEKYGNLIPVPFVLGFYVSLVIGRWWAQYKTIPWIDTLADWVNISIKGQEDEQRVMRRTICRYVCLSITQCFTLISSQTKKRFPTTDHYIAAGLLLEDEKAMMENIIAGIPKYQTHWIPFVWASTIVGQAREDGKINNDAMMRKVIDEINNIKTQCCHLLNFDRIRVPLVYTQNVTIAVYSYFFSCIIGRQWTSKHEETNSYPDTGNKEKFSVDEFDLFVPAFTILQLIFYIGWLKVAESLVNPFGDDDYDFELNWMVDRHLQVAYSIVDKMHYQNPKMQKDAHWVEVVPRDLPHTLASVKCNNDPPLTSTDAVTVSNSESEIINLSKLSISTIAKAKMKFKRPIVFPAEKSSNQNGNERNGSTKKKLGSVINISAVTVDETKTPPSIMASFVSAGDDD